MHIFMPFVHIILCVHVHMCVRLNVILCIYVNYDRNQTIINFKIKDMMCFFESTL